MVQLRDGVFDMINRYANIFLRTEKNILDFKTMYGWSTNPQERTIISIYQMEIGGKVKFRCKAIETS